MIVGVAPNLDVLDGTWAWIWKERPEPVGFCRGLIVRAANGNNITDPQGFSFSGNYAWWRQEFSGPMIAWTYLYATSSPAQAAQALALSPAIAYLIDWEDAAGPAPSGDQFAACVRELRARRPGVPIGFSSYPTRAQALAHGVDWDVGLAVCDFVAPQMYYGYQIAKYAQVLADARPLYVQLDVEPTGSVHWSDDVAKHLASGQGVSFWRLAMLTDEVRRVIGKFQVEGEDMSAADVQAIIEHVDWLFRLGDHGTAEVGHSNHRALIVGKLDQVLGKLGDLGDLLDPEVLSIKIAGHLPTDVTSYTLDQVTDACKRALREGAGEAVTP